MILLIAGSRSIKELNISPYLPDDIDLIISGGAPGIDTIAEEYADRHKISKLILRPKYHLYRRAAPLKRNDKMVELCDSVLVFWDGKSKGTKHTNETYYRICKKDWKVITGHYNIRSVRRRSLSCKK